MSKQVLSIEQMQHLQELGVDTSKASMWWCRIIRPACPPTKKEKVMVDWFLSLRKEVMHTGLDVVETIPTFTLQDIIDLLPRELDTDTERYNLDMWFSIFYNIWRVEYDDGECLYSDNFFTGEELIDAAYEMLCWCIEQGYIDTNK